jgi:hypothetical protein
MSEQILRDKKGNLIAYIKEESNQLVIRDAHRNLLGYYDPKTNITRDKHRNKVGTGNLLTTLL